MAYTTPIYNLRAVTRKTGVKASTLRAWERRYGVPCPERTEGGHRLYSQRDIDLIKWLLVRRQEGMRIKSAVELCHQLEGSGQAPWQRVPQRPQATATAEDALAELRQAWLSACLAFDEQGAEQILTQAFALYPPETVSFELLQKGLSFLGEGWFQGEVTVQQEHFASTLSMRHLDALLMSAPPPTRPGRILVACPPRERHAFSLLLLTFLLKRRGWDALFLGPDVPIARIEKTLATIRPKLVILAAQQLDTAASLMDMARFLQREAVLASYGGRIFNPVPALRDRIPAHFLGQSLASAPQMVEELISAPRPVPSVAPPSEAYRQALAHFGERQLLIESDVLRTLNGTEIAHDHLLETNRELTDTIAAALALGDIRFVDAHLDWWAGVRSSDYMAANLRDAYLAALHQAAKAYLGAPGALTLDWLAERTERRERN
jgi:DNA-binding transcriptional MerR regulator